MRLDPLQCSHWCPVDQYAESKPQHFDICFLSEVVLTCSSDNLLMFNAGQYIKGHRPAISCCSLSEPDQGYHTEDLM